LRVPRFRSIEAGIKDLNNYTLIAAAVPDELSGLLNRIKSSAVLTIGGRRIISGFIDKRPVKILITGPGIINNVQALTAVIEKIRPALIIQTGSAGAFKMSNLGIGDLGIATMEIDAGLGLESREKGAFIEELPFSLLKTDNVNIKNYYPLHDQLINLVYDQLTELCKIKGIGLKKGPFITVSMITATDERAEKLYNWFKPCMENMEGSGAAYLSIYYNIPFFEIRSASNMVGKRNKKKWNFQLSCEHLAWAVYELLVNLRDY